MRSNNALWIAIGLIILILIILAINQVSLNSVRSPQPLDTPEPMQSDFFNEPSPSDTISPTFIPSTIENNI